MPINEDSHASRLSHSLLVLHDQVNEHEIALEKLRQDAYSPPIDEPSQDPRVRLQQLEYITEAYTSLGKSEPQLPSEDSPVPRLLAMRTSLNHVDQYKDALKGSQANLVNIQHQLSQEQAELERTNLETKTLENQIEKRRLVHGSHFHTQVANNAKAMIHEQQQRKIQYAQEVRKLVKAFRNFVDEHLAMRLAAEDLKGPAVGDDIEINEAILRTGFTNMGKVKKPMAKNARNEAKREIRNHVIWGSDSENDENDKPKSERDLASANFRSLTENLLNAAANEEDHIPYISLSRESAGVRFLVRAKIARFDPEDARKLCLLEFDKLYDHSTDD